MQVVSTLSSNSILGTRSEPDVGGSHIVNGQFVTPTPPGVSITVDSTSYLTPQDASSVPGQIASEFLIRNPIYDHVLWSFFVEEADIAALDISSVAPSPTALNVSTGTLPTLAASPNGPRCKVGRGVGPAPLGIAPNSVALLPRNLSRATATYGGIVTDTIDTTPYTGASGTDEVMIWWKIASLSTSEDIVSGYNLTAGTNEPALRSLVEIDQEPAALLVYASVDDGVTWHEIRYMEPTDLVTAGTDLRLAFINQGNTEIYLIGYVLLFADAP